MPPKDSKDSKESKSSTPQARELKEVWDLVTGKADSVSGEEQIALLLRGSGLTIYDAEVKKVVEKFGGKLSFQAYEAWFAENAKYYQRASEDGEKALMSLLAQGLLGGPPGSKQVDVKDLSRLLSVIGDQVPAEVTQKVLRGCEAAKSGKVTPDELMAFLHGHPQKTLPLVSTA